MSTNNQNLAVQSYQKEFKELMQAVFGAQSYFGDFFAGGLEAIDGIKHNAVAFSVKTSDVPVVVGNSYDKGANVAMGTGTSKGNRFGDRKEIIYADTDVPYSWEWTIHEGIDRHTVNNNLETAIADRLELQARAKTQLFNRKHSDFIAEVATKTETLSDYTADKVLVLFNELSKYYINIGAIGTKVAKVNADLYNAIIDHPISTTAKNADVNIGENRVLKFKGFIIEEIPEDLMKSNSDNYAAYTYITGIGKAFTGINTARAIESEDFDGKALQGAGKAGEFILDDNKKAVVKVKAPTAP